MGFMFFDLHVSLKQPFVGVYKFVEFVLFNSRDIQKPYFGQTLTFQSVCVIFKIRTGSYILTLS